MAYGQKNFDGILGMEGFSDALLKNHFGLYGGYVTNTNKLMDTLAAMEKEGNAGTQEYAELKRRFGWEFNGMRLHELYFGNMRKGGAKLKDGSPLHNKILEDFGSYKNWEKDFRATGGMRGIGWAILYYDKMGKKLFNCWVNEHDAGHLSGCVPLLVMDVFEHAFMPEYGKRPDYINAFMNAVDWDTVSERFEGK